MIKVQSTSYPMGPLQTWRPKPITIGEMKSFWEQHGHGHFNEELYTRISTARAKKTEVSYEQKA